MHQRIEQFLDVSHVTYRVWHDKDMPFAIKAPADFANAVQYDYCRITKTLLLRANEQDSFCLVVAPFNRRVNFRMMSKALGVQRVQLATLEELSRVLGYPPTAVSPLGAGPLPIFLDRDLLEYPTVLIGFRSNWCRNRDFA